MYDETLVVVLDPCNRALTVSSGCVNVRPMIPAEAEPNTFGSRAVSDVGDAGDGAGDDDDALLLALSSSWSSLSRVMFVVRRSKKEESGGVGYLCNILWNTDVCQSFR